MTNKKIKDSDNPDFAFGSISTKLLVDFVNPKIDVHYYIRKELANRGLDRSGFWVGSKRAKEIHNIK